MPGLLGGIVLPQIPAVPSLSSLIPNVQIPSVSDLISSGIPPLPSFSNFLPSDVSSLVPSALGSTSTSPVPAKRQWGIFDANNKPIVVADSVLGVEFRKESRVSNYLVEQGSFASYNKVQQPFDARVRFALGQTVAARTAFLTALDAAAISLNTYQVSTPEFTYLSATIDHYDYRRESDHGANMLIVDVWLIEIRTVTPATVNTTTPNNDDGLSSDAAQHLPADQVTDPASADPVSLGTIQSLLPTSLQAAAASVLPTSYPLGFTQGALTGFISNAAGTIQRDATAQIGNLASPLLKQIPGL